MVDWTPESFERILDALPNPLFVKDRQHRWILINESFCRFIGHPRHALLGKSDYEFFPEEEADVFWSKDNEVFATDAPIANEEWLTDAEGSKRWILTLKQRSFLPDGEAILIGIITDITYRKQAEALRNEFVKQVVAAQEEERRRVAQEIHDVTGQLLASLQVNLRALEDAQSLEEVRSKSRALRELGAQTLGDIARVATGLHPAVLDDLGLAAALRSYTEEACRTHGIRLQLHIDELPAWLTDSREIATTFYRVAQEAMTNVVRHAGASELSVVLQQRGDVVRLLIEDDGRGFEVDAVSPAAGLGLLGMRERAALVGAAFSIESAPGAGATVCLDISESAAHGDFEPAE